MTAASTLPPPKSTIKSKKGRRQSKIRASLLPQTLPLDGSNSSHVLAYVADVSDEVNRRVREINDLTKQRCIELRSAFKVCVMKLPRNVRSQSIKNFNVKIDAGNARYESPQKRGDAYGGSFAGGGGRVLRSAVKVGQTPSRRLKKDELFVSLNGSPLHAGSSSSSSFDDDDDDDGEGGDIVATVKKSRSGKYVPVIRGVITKKGANKKELTEEQRVDAVCKLKTLQDEVRELMRQLGN